MSWTKKSVKTSFEDRIDAKISFSEMTKPQKLEVERSVKGLIEEGKPEDSAWAIAVSQMQDKISKGQPAHRKKQAGSRHFSPEELESIFANMESPDQFVEACYNGSWDEFLDDNPGVKTAVLDWLTEIWGSGKAPFSPEQADSLRSMAEEEGWFEKEEEFVEEALDNPSGRGEQG